MAGRGMHLLRLARPESVPLVLLLDPPPPCPRPRAGTGLSAYSGLAR
jgi:hypothetical protein